MKTYTAVLALTLALWGGACGESPMASRTAGEFGIQAQVAEGSGLVLQSLTGITLPLIGRVGDVAVDEAVITNIRLVQDPIGQIVACRPRACSA